MLSFTWKSIYFRNLKGGVESKLFLVSPSALFFAFLSKKYNYVISYQYLFAIRKIKYKILGVSKTNKKNLHFLNRARSSDTFRWFQVFIWRSFICRWGFHTPFHWLGALLLHVSKMFLLTGVMTEKTWLRPSVWASVTSQ